jgi:hypothetical protein
VTDYLALVCIALPAVLLVMAASAKAAGGNDTAAAVFKVLRLPNGSPKLRAVVGTALIGIELLAGAAAMTVPSMSTALALVIAYSCITAVSVVGTVTRAGPCACFGSLSRSSYGPRMIARNTSLLALGVIGASALPDRAVRLDASNVSIRLVVVLLISGFVVATARTGERLAVKGIR